MTWFETYIAVCQNIHDAWERNHDAIGRLESSSTFEHPAFKSRRDAVLNDLLEAGQCLSRAKRRLVNVNPEDEPVQV